MHKKMSSVNLMVNVFSEKVLTLFLSGDVAKCNYIVSLFHVFLMQVISPFTKLNKSASSTHENKVSYRFLADR